MCDRASVAHIGVFLFFEKYCLWFARGVQRSTCGVFIHQTIIAHMQIYFHICAIYLCYRVYHIYRYIAKTCSLLYLYMYYILIIIGGFSCCHRQHSARCTSITPPPPLPRPLYIGAINFPRAQTTAISSGIDDSNSYVVQLRFGIRWGAVVYRLADKISHSLRAPFDKSDIYI